MDPLPIHRADIPFIHVAWPTHIIKLKSATYFEVEIEIEIEIECQRPLTIRIATHLALCDSFAKVFGNSVAYPMLARLDRPVGAGAGNYGPMEPTLSDEATISSWLADVCLMVLIFPRTNTRCRCSLIMERLHARLVRRIAAL